MWISIRILQSVVLDCNCQGSHLEPFSHHTIFGVQRFYSIKTIAFTQCLHWLIVSGSVTPNLGQPTWILITELFVSAWTGRLFLWAEHSTLLWFSWHDLTLEVGVGNPEPSLCWWCELRASQPPVKKNAMKSKGQVLMLAFVWAQKL